MKQLQSFLLAILLFATTLCKAQQQLVAHLAFNPIGDNYNVILLKSADGFKITTRQVPGREKPLLYTDSTTIIDNEASGYIKILNYNCRFKGYFNADSVNINLVSVKNGATIGNITASKYFSISYAYKDVINAMMQQTHQYIYDTTLLNKKEWKSFENQVVAYGNMVQDDIELIGLVNMSMQKLPFTHYGIGKMSQSTWENFYKAGYETATPATLTKLSETTALLHVQSFSGDGKSLENFMQQVIAANYKNLIIDLRDNSGGGAGATIALSKYLSNKPQVAGALLTNKWFKNHSGLPTEKDYTSFSTFTGGSTIDLINSFTKHEGIILKAVPASQTFEGKIFILTNGNTASACEPFVYGMQYFKRATIIGTKTAGAMLSKIPFDLNNGFKLFLPVTDYYTIDGVRLDKNGIEPNIATTSAEALNKALELISQ